MRYGQRALSFFLWAALFTPFGADCFGQELRRPWLQVGPITLRPSGFFDDITMYRSATTADSVSTRFAAIPLEETPGQWLNSPRHSRAALEAGLEARGRWLGYYESDFLDAPGRSSYRLRQLWGQYERGSWKILAGEAWSLLRPNRAGISSQGDLMNTIVVEPAYHVGLAGVRNRQLRVTRTLGAWQAALAWEYRRGGNATFKLARDGGRAHWEAVALAGHGGRKGAGVAAVLRASSRLSWVSQQLFSAGLGPDLVGPMPAGARAHSTLHGLEARLSPRLEAFAYGGVAYAGRSAGNRVVRQWTAGFHRKLFEHAAWGSTSLSFQYSQLDRSLWSGARGRMNYLMIGLRHFLPARR